MSYETNKHLQEHIKMDGLHQNLNSNDLQGFQNRNPLICYVCQDYFNEPCILQCYHTFCTRCIRGQDIDGKLTCPLCGQQTQLREGNLPPADLLMQQLLELANNENPPCSNCDVRDRNNMYYCNTCGQALCNHCRENTHRAKMFSTHEVLHMSKCAKEPKKCPIHGEQYIMFSNAQKTMLCVNCFRDTAAEKRSFCIDIDTAYSQASKRLERAQGGINELQNSIREGLIMFKNLMDELRQNMDSEKHTINTFCQGMQEAIAKTHANMIMEVQRQYETKEKVFRNQLMTLGGVLPTLQLHCLLCTNFANTASKFQFLELVYLMFDRLNAVTQLSHPLRPIQSSTIRTNYRNEFAQSLEPWVGKAVLTAAEPVSSDVIYDSATSKRGVEPNSGGAPTTSAAQQLFSHPSKKQQSMLKMKLLEEESPFSNHCRTFENQVKELCTQLTGVKERLESLHRDVTLIRRENLPPLSMRFECISRDCSLLDETLERHLNELDRLKLVFDTIWEEQLCRIHVEQEIFHSQISDIVMLRNELKRLSTIAQQLEPYISSTQQPGGGGGSTMGDEDMPDAASFTNHQQLQTLLEHIGLLQSENLQLKSECKLHPTGAPSASSDAITFGDTIPTREVPKSKGRATSSGDLTIGRKQMGIASIEAHSSEQKRNVISQLIDKVNRKKSPSDEFRGQQTCTNVTCIKEKERTRSTSSVQQPGQLTKEKSFVKSGQKTASAGIQQTTATIERLESHIKEKFHDMLNRRQSRIDDGIVTLPTCAKSQKSFQDDSQKYPKNIELQIDSSIQQDFANLVHRKISKNDLEKLALLSQTTKALESKKIGKSCDRLNELKSLKLAPSESSSPRQKYTHVRSKTPDNSQRYCSKTSDGNVQQQQGTVPHRSKPTDKVCEKYRSKTPTEGSGQHVSRASKMTSESEYQHISNATSSLKRDKGKYKQNRSTPSSPKGSSSSGTRKPKVYPYSDGEEEFYRRQQSGERTGHKQKMHMEHPCGSGGKKTSQHRTAYKQNSFESLSTLSLNSRRSSLENADKTLVLVIGTRNKTQSSSNKSLNKSSGSTPQQSQRSKSDKSPGRKGDKSDFSLKQRSWETFPPKKHRANGNRSYHYCQLMDANNEPPRKQPLERKESSSSGRKENEKFATITKSISVQKRNIDTKVSDEVMSLTTQQLTKNVNKKQSQRQQKMIAERGYYSEYELDFDTDNPDDGEMSDNIFGFENEMKLTIDRRSSKEHKINLPARDYPTKFSTFKGESTSYAKESKSENTGAALTTFKGPAVPSHLSTFKGEKTDIASSSGFKGDNINIQSHMSTFKGESSNNSPHFRKFQGYFKGESSQSLSSYDQRQTMAVPGDEGMKKADSFEGHEEAVRTLVAAVQETRTAAARKSK